MADPNFKKISDMAALTTAAADDIIPIVDVSEAADANKNKKITTANLRKNITNAELAGSITASKIAGISSDPNADRIVFWDDSATSLAYLAPSTGLQVTDTSITTKDSEIVHDSLSGFVANEHINHSAVTITAGAGLSGGGTIAGNRTINLDHLGIEDLTDPGADRIAFWDDSAGAMKWLTAGSGLQISATTINAAAITGTEIADDSVDSNHIAAGAIDLEHMSANSVDSNQYVDGSIDRVHLSADIIDGTKLADNAVGNEHIRDSAALSVIGRSSSSSGNPADIAAGADGYVLRRSGTTLGFGQVANAGIANLAVTNSKLGADAVNGTKIADDSINSEHYVNGSIDQEHLSVGASKISYRQGGSATNWRSTGTTNYALTSATIQFGSSWIESDATYVTFPVPFSVIPLIFFISEGNTSALPGEFWDVSETGFYTRYITNHGVAWIAIGAV